MKVSTSLSIQESLYPERTCFGCGHATPQGFQLRSYREGDLTVAEFAPLPEHDNVFGFGSDTPNGAETMERNCRSPELP
jgi:hypothetical protein